MKNSLLILAMLFSATMFAQNSQLRPVEFDLGGGVTIGGAGSAVPGPAVYFEFRTPLNHSTWDVGAQLTYGETYRKSWKASANDYGTIKYGLIVFCDHNFREKGRVSPFAGIGFGRAEAEVGKIVHGDDLLDVSSETVYVLNPRVGVELWDHLRVTAEYKCSFDILTSYFSLNIGYTFGLGK